MPEELRLTSRSAREYSPTLRDLAAVPFRQRRLVVIVFPAIFLLVVTYGLVFPPYQSEMKLLLRHSRVDPAVTSVPSQPEFEREGVTEEEVNSEAELLQDDEILRSVVQHAGLISEGHSWLWSLAGDNEQRQLQRAARRIGRRLTVEAAHKASLITVTYDSSDPQQGPKVLDALGNAYLARHHQVHRPSGAANFFEQQVEQSGHGLEQAELRLMEFDQLQGVVSATQERDFALQKLTEADADARQTQVAIAQTLERMQVLETKSKLLPERVVTQVRNLDNPELLEKLKSHLLDLELKRTELLTQYEPSYRLVQEVDQEIAQAKTTIAQEEQTPIRDQTSDIDPNQAWVKAELLKAQVESITLKAHANAEATVLAHYTQAAQWLGNRAVQQDRLFNDLKSAEEKYLLYVNKREEARIGDALDQGGLLNVVIAEKPTEPALPKLSLAMFGLIGMLLAAPASLGLAFVVDYLDPSFRTPDEISSYLGSPVLASLPRQKLLGANHVRWSRSQ
jgi:uncharacterized protein involved in exopolysaccharide biosynthesis